MLLETAYSYFSNFCTLDTTTLLIFSLFIDIGLLFWWNCTHKTDDIYKDIGEDFKTRFDTSKYELDKSLPKGKNKKLIELMKDELGGKIMTKFVGLRAKLIVT